MTPPRLSASACASDTKDLLGGQHGHQGNNRGEVEDGERLGVRAEGEESRHSGSDEEEGLRVQTLREQWARERGWKGKGSALQTACRRQRSRGQRTPTNASNTFFYA